MSFLLTGFHPSFDALSAHADLSDVHGARSRVGRHLARCAVCREQVDEIRAIGESVRQAELPAAPAGLWDRIERAAATSQRMPTPARPTPEPESDSWKGAPALRPTTHGRPMVRTGLRRGGIALLAAAAVMAVLLWPTSNQQPLEAGASVGRWRLAPAFPAPGTVVQVRYEPPAGATGDPAVMLLGSTLQLSELFSGDTPDDRRLQDSLTTLVRQGDGAYVGRFTTPRSLTAMTLRLSNLQGSQIRRFMSSDGPVSRVPDPVALLVGGSARGGPALRSLSAAAQLWTGSRDIFYTYVVGDTLIKYFADEPIGYALDRTDTSRRLLDDVIAWFGRGERQYLRFDRRFMEAQSVSADHMLDMIVFAHRISEPGEVRKWTLRLAREHPADPRALDAYGRMLDGMFNRYATSDTVRRDLPLADSLWARNGGSGSASAIGAAALRAGDTAAYHRWTRRTVETRARDFRGALYGISDAMLVDPAVRVSLVPMLRREVANDCRLPGGKVPHWNHWMSWEERCQADRASAYTMLSVVERIDGRFGRAIALADSAVALHDAGGRCWSGGARRMRGKARLAMGDTAAALPDLASELVTPNWQTEALRDSLKRMLRPAVSEAAWNTAITEQAGARQRCLENANRIMRERRAAEQAPPLR